MQVYLLDVNVLIALFDPAHINHDSAHRWFEKILDEHWASCPITENGFIRIISNPGYPNIDISPRDALAKLKEFIDGQKNHQFWLDDISILDCLIFEHAVIQGYRQITDTYLLGLCKKRGGTLATLDNTISKGTIIEPSDDLIVLL